MITMKLSPNSYIVEKINELYSLMQNRFGVCVLGPTLAGKSTVINILESSLNKLYKDECLDSDKARKKSIYGEYF